MYAEIYPTEGNPFRIMGLHLKSKGIYTALEWSNWWNKADSNRKRILAQATQIRLNFLDPYLRDSETKNIPLIVCGDINDGPGFDTSERRLLGSGVERLMGSIWHPSLCLGNAIFDTLSVENQNTLNFEKVHTATYSDPIFNSMYQKDWIDHILYTKNGTANWISGAVIHHEMSGGKKIWEKYPNSSDHRPISVTVNP